jgi:hypothetical protein
MSQKIKSRKYSRKGISSAPKSARAYKSAVNKILWRKYHLRRSDLDLSVDAITGAFAEGKLTADAFVAQVVKGS